MRPFAVMATAGLLATLCGWPAPAGATDDPLRPQQWYLDAIKAPAPGAITGIGDTLVAVVDTGVDTQHPDLKGVVSSGPSLTGTGAGDPNGHGTNVAGIIGARAGDGEGISGAAAGARILSIRVLGADMQGTTRLVADGIDAAVAAGAQVINLSLGPGPALARTLDLTDPVVPAMQRAVKDGVVIVAAAGNDAMPLCAQPLVVTGILCVGAVNRQLGPTSYTNYGLRVDVVAPGGDDQDPIVSDAPGGGYAGMAGTSQATPQVAALAALLVAQGLRGQAVVDRIRGTATDLGAPGEDGRFGRGLIDMQAATGVSAAGGPGRAASVGSPRPAPITLGVPSALDARALLRSGSVVRCRVSVRGTCRVQVRSGRHLLAEGERRLAAHRTADVRLHPTIPGRRRIRTVQRMQVSVRAHGPRGGWVARTVWIRR